MIQKIFKMFKADSASRPAPPSAEEMPAAEREDEAPAGRTEADQQRAQPAKKRRRRRKKRKPSSGQQPAAVNRPAAEPWDPASFTVPEEAGKTRFHDLGLPEPVMHAIADLGFAYCTPIQAEAMPQTLAGHDLVGQAQTGTGKTAAFLVTLLTRLLASPLPAQRKGAPRSLVLAPTRELVMQITREAEELGRYCPLSVASVFGGMDYQKQREQVSGQAVDILVATPGRLLDFMRQRALSLEAVEILVLDEADRMLDMGFIPDVRRIVLATPAKEKRQTLFFSATMTPEVSRLASQWTRKAIQVEIQPEQVEGESVEQIVYLTTAKEKYHLLYNLITRQDLKRVMIFANRRDETRRLADRLKRNGISCAMLSGEVSQKQRIKTLEDFRHGKIRVLVATDVAGRGIHIDDVSHVINYTLPYDPEDYVHRIGRTGRAGATGISVSFACEEGSFYLPDIEEFLGHKLECTHPEPELLTPAPRGTVRPSSRAAGGERSSSGRSRRRRPRRRPGKRGS